MRGAWVGRILLPFALLACPDAGKGATSELCDPGAQSSPAAGDVVIPYPGTGGASPSRTFTLRVNDSPVFVEDFEGVSYARFAFAGTAHVQIGSNDDADASSYRLSPQSFGIATANCQGAQTFDLAVPRKLLFWDGDDGPKLFIFADSLEDHAYAPGDPDVTDIASYGVKADGKTVLTGTIQRALDAVATRTGGGVLYFGAGTYSTGSLRIGNHTTVYLAPGATLRGTGVPSDYPEDPDLSDGVGGHRSAVPGVYQLEFDNAVGSRITGRGTVDMNGTILRGKGSKGGRLLTVKNSKDVVVDGVVLRDPASWNTQIMYSTGVTFTNVKVVNNAGQPWNLDGIDPDSSQNVTVDDTFVYSGDDSFAVKSTGSYKGLVRNPSDIVIRSSAVFTLTAGLKIGTESLAPYAENITFENDDVMGADCAIRALVRDGSILRDDRWRSIR